MRAGVGVAIGTLLAITGCRFGFDSTATGDGGAGDAEAPSVFQPLALPTGGDVLLVRTTPADPAVVYAVASGRLMRSGNRAASWTFCAGPASFVSALAVDPSSAQVVYVGDRYGLHRSDDGCATWVDVWTTQEVTAITLSGTDVLIGAGGLYRLRAGTWSALPSAADGHDVAAIAVGPTGVILASTWDNGAVRSVDDGASFAPANTGLTTPIVPDLLFPDPATPSVVLAQTDDGVYRSTNSGADWTAVSGTTDARNILAVDPGDRTFVLSGTWRGLIESTTGGTSFDGTDRRTANMKAAYVNSITFDPAGTGRVYAGTSRGLFVADSHALVWTASMVGIDAWGIEDLARVPGQGVIYAATPSGVLRSSDSGASWTVESTGMETYVSQLDTVHVPTGANAELWTGGASFLWQSADAGRTYAQNLTLGISGVLGMADQWELRVIRTELPRVWAGTGTRLWHSDDAGGTWYPNAIDVVDRRVNDIVLTGGPELWVATDGGVFRTTDDGLTFQLVPTGLVDPNVDALLRLPDGTVLAATSDGVRSSTGGSWTPRGLAQQRVRALAVRGTTWIAATSSAGVYVSNDQGVTWSVLPGLATRRPRELLIDDAGRLIVGTLGYGLYATAAF